jgi:hypothetical protein
MATKTSDVEALLQKYRLPIEGIGLEGWKHAMEEANTEAAEIDWETAFHSLLEYHEQSRRLMEKEVDALKAIVKGNDVRRDFYRKEYEKQERLHQEALQRERESLREWKQQQQDAMAGLREFYVGVNKGEKNQPIPVYSPADYVVPLPPNLTSQPHHTIVRLLQQTHLHLSAAMDDVEYLRKEVLSLRTGEKAQLAVSSGLPNMIQPPNI